MRKRKLLVTLVGAALVLGLAFLIGIFLRWDRTEVFPQAGSDALPGVAFGRADLVKIGFGYPYLYIRAYSFRGQWTTPEPVFLDREYTFEFIPLMTDAPADRYRLETYLISEGSESLLAACQPYAFRATLYGRVTDSDNRYAVLGSRFRIDLGAYQGRRVALKWVLKDARSGLEADLSAAIGDPKLVPKKKDAERRPPILFICSDAHRYEYALGEKGAALMPRLQQLSRQAVVYRQAFSNASWTLPSIVSMFTGMPPRFHGTGLRVRTGDIEQLQQQPLAPGRFLIDWGKESAVLTAYPRQLTTLCEHLQKNGYTTAMVLANPLYLLSGLSADGQDVVMDTSVVPGEEVNTSVFGILDRLPNDSPLFLLVHYMDVHHFTQWYFDKQYSGKKPREAKEEWIASYAEAVRDTDRNLGVLLDRWDEAVGLDQSLVVFFADHGEHLLDAGRKVRGHGNSMEEVLLHVPLVIKYPSGTLQEPGEATAPVALADLYRLTLELAGLSMEAQSLRTRPSFDAEAKGEQPSRYIYADYQLYGDELSSVREGPWKLVSNRSNQAKRLFDVRLPLGAHGELDRMVEEPAVQRRLEGALQEYVRAAEQNRAGLISEQVVDPQEALKALRALGYTQ